MHSSATLPSETWHPGDTGPGGPAVTPKPIAFLIDELEVGGSQRQILVLARAFKEAGHAVTVAYFRGENATLRPTFEAAGVVTRLILKRSGLDPVFFTELSRFLSDDPARLVLTFGYTASLWTRLAGFTASGPRPVSCIRNFSYLPTSSAGYGAFLGRVERVLAQRSRWIVANSSVTADSIVARGIVPEDKMLVIPNAVEQTAHAPRERARARLRALVGGVEDGAGSPIVGTLARLVDVKDLPTLLRAAREVADAIPGARFIIGGEGPERAALEALRAELGLEAHVLLPGTLDGHDVITGLDVAVLTSTSEGMPNFVVEAMAAPGVLEALRAPADAHARAERAAAKVRDMTPAAIARRYLALFD
jgi:glycosyltransferase involved in cell wall biosynthesis